MPNENTPTPWENWWKDWTELVAGADVRSKLIEVVIHRGGHLSRHMGEIDFVELPSSPFVTPAKIWLTWCIEKASEEGCCPAPEMIYIPVNVLESRPYRISEHEIFISMGVLGHLTITTLAPGVMHKIMNAWLGIDRLLARLEELQT